MARANWFNENRGRTFPFLQHLQELLEVSETTAVISPGVFSMSLLPNSAVVDFGATMGTQAFFEEGVHRVYLFEVRREATTFAFEFRSTAPGLVSKPLIFRRSIISDDYETEYVETATEEDVSHSGTVSESQCVEDSIWQAYMVSGTMVDLAAVLTATGEKLQGDTDDVIVEPALVRNLLGQYARSFNLANADRSRAQNPSDCVALSWPFVLAPIYVNHECIIGTIRLKEGFNTLIDQDNVGNSLTINAAVGGGAGEPCAEVPLFAAEAPPVGGSLLSGGPDCNDVIRSINGVGGQVLRMIGGQGIVITSEPSRHRVIVDVNMSNLKICPVGDDPAESSDVETSTSFCGPS